MGHDHFTVIFRKIYMTLISKDKVSVTGNEVTKRFFPIRHVGTGHASDSERQTTAYSKCVISTAAHCNRSIFCVRL